MKFIFLWLLLPTVCYSFVCKDPRHVVTEKNVSLVFCEINQINLDEKCARKGKTCELLVALEANLPTIEYQFSKIYPDTGSPGTRLCKTLGWTILMAEMYEGSQICTCRHPKGGYITCSSLDDYFRFR